MTRILLIEDNQDHAELIERSLTKGLKEISVLQTCSAHEAYQILSKRSFDLILCDYYLPDVRGENHIRQLSRLAPETPVVVVTGQGDEKIAARSIKAGAEDYVVKTRDALAALPNILKRAMAKHQSHQHKKKQEIKKHLHLHTRTAEKVLGEMEKIQKKMNFLKRGGKTTKAKPDLLNSISSQVEGLKKFILKKILGSK